MFTNSILGCRHMKAMRFFYAAVYLWPKAQTIKQANMSPLEIKQESIIQNQNPYCYKGKYDQVSDSFIELLAGMIRLFYYYIIWEEIRISSLVMAPNCYRQNANRIKSMTLL